MNMSVQLILCFGFAYETVILVILTGVQLIYFITSKNIIFETIGLRSNASGTFKIVFYSANPQTNCVKSWHTNNELRINQHLGSVYIILIVKEKL